MKSNFSHWGPNWGLLVKTTLTVLLSLALVGCSNADNPAETAQSDAEDDIQQLTTENKQLRIELDEKNSELEMAKAKVKELEDELKTMQGTQTPRSSSVPTTTNITPPEHTPRELLIGEWFYQGFHEEGIFSFTQTLVFNMDGTGAMNRRYYIPKNEIEEIKNSPVPLSDIDTSAAASWALDGDTVHITLDNGETADFTFLPKQQQLQMINGSDKYGKERPKTMEQYVERALYAEDIQAKEAARMRRFLGMWYFDVLTWTFNEDGTGVIDIPKLGDQPATTRKFTYSVSDDSSDPTYLCLTLDWEDGHTSYFYPEFKTDGSVSLKGFDDSEVMKLTRKFDANNCPISTQIIQNGIGVMSGSMFSEILGEG